MAEVILLLEKGVLTACSVVVREQLHGWRRARIQVQWAKFCSFPRTDPGFPLCIPLRPWWSYGVPSAVGTRLISFLSLQYIGSLDVPRPNSRVEIVTAMRRIRVSVARLLLPLPHPSARASPPRAPAALSCINPDLQCIHNSVFPSLCCHLCVAWAQCLRAVWHRVLLAAQPSPMVPGYCGCCVCSLSTGRAVSVLPVLHRRRQEWAGRWVWDIRLLAPDGNCSVSMIGSISSFVSPSNKVATSYLCKFPRDFTACVRVSAAGRFGCCLDMAAG